jgi:hypothetical protein
MRILITGSREWSDTLTIVGALLSAVPSEADLRDVTVVHGGCPTGADFFAARAAGELGFLVEEHPADWAEHGKAAGPVRNQGMVDAGADVCLAFFQPGAANRGTQDCVIRAMRAGIPIKRYPEGGVSVPAGDSPDSPPAGESRLPGGSDDYLPSENRPDDSAGIEAVTPLTKISHIPSNGILVYDMVVPTYWPPVEWKPLRNALAGSRADEGSTN